MLPVNAAIDRTTDDKPQTLFPALHSTAGALTAVKTLDITIK